jgi:hypothetical protein
VANLLRLISFIASVFLLVIGPLELMRSVLPPDDRLLSGPLYHGWLFIAPPFLAAFYLALLLSYARSKSKTSPAPLSTIKFSPLSYLILGCAAAVYIFGVGAYWFVTPSGLTIHRHWFAPPTTYSWDDIIKRNVVCYIGRHNDHDISFTVTFRDGFAIDLSETQKPDVVDKFTTLMNLTRAGETAFALSNLALCPNSVTEVLSRKRKAD